jgi:uncharacterized phage protein gp47/JayE
MTFGLTDQGFVPKRLQDVKAEIEDAARTVFGPAINLLPTELMGEFIGIVSLKASEGWEAGESIYNSFYPATAKGTSLDNVVSITGIERLGATKSTAVAVATGTETTLIAAGSVVSVDGNPDARFVTTEDFTIGPGTDEVQQIDFSAVPTSGTFTLIFDGDETVTIAWDDTAGDVQTALNNLSTLSSVTVAGDFTAGFAVTFAGTDGQKQQPLISLGDNSLVNGVDPVEVTFSETTLGVLPNVEVTLEGETAGSVQAPSGSLTVIETVTPGWDSIVNAEDAVVGKDIETDAALRLRRDLTLSAPATGTVDAIRAKILEIEEVDDAAVYHNPTQTTDAEGRPPHSIDIIVLNGDDTVIAEAIWSVAPAGIELLGNTSVPILDSQSMVQNIKFSRPNEVNIWIELDLTTDNNFPSDGATVLRDYIVSYCNDKFKIGDDVIVFGTDSIASAIADSDVAGIIRYEIRIGSSASPTLDDNIIIAFDEIGDFDTSRVTVTEL